MRRLSAFLIEFTSVREPQARWTRHFHWLIHQFCWGSERLQGNRGQAALFWRHDPLRSAKRESNRRSDPRHKWAKASFESFGGLQRPQLAVVLQIVCQATHEACKMRLAPSAASAGHRNYPRNTELLLR